MRRRDQMVLTAVEMKQPNRNGWARANCPFCELRVDKPDRKQCLGLHLPTGKWHCFRCGSGGRLESAAQEELEITADIVAETEKVREAMDPPPGFVEIYEEPAFESLSAQEPLGYLRGRGLSDEMGRAAKVGAVWGAGKWSNRVVVPIFDVDQTTWLGWSARAWYQGSDMKYRYPPGMERATLLYNHAALHVETDTPALVVEGVFDALALWPDGVALLGKTSGHQKEALLMARRPVVMVLDGDAWLEAEAVSLMLRFEGLRAGWVRLPAEVDPDEVDRRELERKAREALR